MGEVKAVAIAADQRACAVVVRLVGKSGSSETSGRPRGRASAHRPPRKAEAGCPAHGMARDAIIHRKFHDYGGRFRDYGESLRQRL